MVLAVHLHALTKSLVCATCDATITGASLDRPNFQRGIDLAVDIVMRAPFVAIVALAAGCSSTDLSSSSSPDASTDASPDASSCDTARSLEPCSREGQKCVNTCAGSGPYSDLLCRDGKWTSTPNGFCNPPGWPFPDTGTAPDTADADAADACAAIGTFDIATEDMARSICAMSSPCKVCVQTTTDAGPTQWMALQMPESCACPAATAK
jgi:hypothetical protein